MKTKILLLLVTFFAVSINAQTFNWEGGTSINGGGTYVRQTISGVQAECTNSSNALQHIDGGGFAGSSGYIVTCVSSTTSITITFNTAINIQSIYAFDGNASASDDWTFSPIGGANSNVIENIGSAIGVNVNVNWTNVTGFTITSANGTDRFAIDNIVFTPYTTPPCTITIPDVNFKNYLVNNTAINTNGDTEIQCNEATAFTGEINCSSESIFDLTGIESFTNLTRLSCQNNSLTALDISNNTALTRLYCGNNSLTVLDVLSNTALTHFYCSGNVLTEINVSTNTSLVDLICYNNNLTYLNVANGNNAIIVTPSFNATNNPNLTCITVDDVAYSTTNWTNIDAQTNFSTNCAALGVNEFTLQNIVIFPNPVINSLNIQLNDTLEKIEVYSVLGRKVLEKNTSRVNMSLLSSGMYLLKIYSKDGKIGIKRFVKE